MKITLKERKLPSGKISLLIEYYKGSEISPEGKRRHIREFENLQLVSKFEGELYKKENGLTNFA